VAGGPLGAHVYTSPGTYTVTLVVNDGTSSRQTTTTITVIDQDTFYSGKTICVSTDGSTGWGPSGATYTTTIPDLSYNTTLSGYRILFKRGQDFSGDAASTINITTNLTDAMIGAAGSGADPIITSCTIGSYRPQAADSPIWPDRITLANLYCKNGYVIGGYGSHHLAYQCTVDPACTNVDIGWSAYYMFSDPYQFIPIAQWEIPKYHIAYECYHPGSATTSYTLFGQGTYMAIMGCTMSQVMYHNMRFTQIYKCLIAGNVLEGISPNSSYHTLKLHGTTTDPFPNSLTDPTSSGWASQYNVIQYNKFGSTSCTFPWLIALSPENDTSVEGVADCLVLNNTFVRNPTMEGSQTDIILGGRNLTYIGNTGTTGTFNVGTGHTTALPAEWRGPYWLDRSATPSPLA
jgi:PKD repeat protein